MESKPFIYRTGKPRIWETPEALEADIVEYVQYVFDNPFLEDKIFIVGQGDGISSPQHEALKKPRIISVGGFCSYVGHTNDTLANYEKYDDGKYLAVIKKFRHFCMHSQIEMAASGQAKENIIARLNNLSEKTETKNETKATVTLPEGLDGLLIP